MYFMKILSIMNSLSGIIYYYTKSQYKKMQQSFQNIAIFTPISLSHLNNSLNRIDWKQRIYRLDNRYIFKFNLSQFISSNLWDRYRSFLEEGLRYVTLKTYWYLRGDNTEQQGGGRKVLDKKCEWETQLNLSSQKLKKIYCDLTYYIKRNKKVYILDILIFLCSLLSRQFLGNLLEQSRKKQIKTQKQSLSELENLEKLCLQNIENTDQIEEKNLLLVQQYTFIIITYETTGNKVSPNCFQIMKIKLVEKNKLTYKCVSFAVSLKIIRQHIQKKKNQINQKRSGVRFSNSQNTYNGSPEQFLATVFQIFDQKEKQIERKSTSKQDKVSLSLHQLLQAHNDNQNAEPSLLYNKLEKINQFNLSKAIKLNYEVKEKDVSLLTRIKKKSQSLQIKKNRHNYWRQIKSIQKPIFHLKNRSNDNLDQICHARKNWQEILKNQKKKFKKSGIQIEKFKSVSNKKEAKERTSRTNSLTNLQKQSTFLPILKQYKMLACTSLTQPSHLQKIIDKIDKKSQIAVNSSLSQSPQPQIQYKLLEFDQNIERPQAKFSSQNKLSRSTKKRTKQQLMRNSKMGLTQKLKNLQKMKEDNNLRKRVFDIRKFKKAFEEKCKDRNNFIQKTNFTDIA